MEVVMDTQGCVDVCTFAVELDNMDKMLMQIELTVIAGDQES